MNSIKESFDNLPIAVCFFDSRGIVRLVNRSMLSVGAMLLGSGIQTLNELRQALQSPPRGIVPVDWMNMIFRFPDGRALRFNEKQITDGEGSSFTEVTAADVTELMEIQRRVREENARLDGANLRLRQLGSSIADIVREEEILSMKMRVHDDLGYSLISVRKAFWQCDDVETLHALSNRCATIIRLLSSGAASSSDPMEDAVERAKAIGVSVTTVGDVPTDAQGRYIAALALRECASNCVRHAGGANICLKAAHIGSLAILTITNDGRAPDGPITEGGGLTELRHRIEKAHGTMAVCCKDRFSLTITLPGEEEKA